MRTSGTRSVAPVGAAILVLLLVPLAAAHAELLASQPADRTVVAEPPREAVIEFSEPVEVRFSSFEIYRLEAEVPEGEPSEREWQRLSGLAGALVGSDSRESAHDEARVETFVRNERQRSDLVTIGLEDELEAGVYVLRWRALSIDTHVVEGFVTFIVAPGE